MKIILALLNLVVMGLTLMFATIAYSQEYPCNNCGGSGTQTCIRCGGSGEYSCSNCGGAGGTWENCNCNNGYVTMPDGTQQVCNYCSGEGRKWHSCYNPICNGGTVSCDFCGGHGEKICPGCNGTGKR